MFSIFRAAGISRRRCAAIGGLWRPQPTLYVPTRPYPTATQPQPFFQPLRNRFPTPITIGKLNQSSTVLKPLVGLGHAKPSSNPPTTTLQPSFVSNPRAIPTQPSHIRYSPTTTQPLAKGFVRRRPKAHPHGASANTPYPLARTFAPPPHFPPRPQHAADATRRYTTLFRHSRIAGILPDSVVIQRVEIAESPVKRAFRGVCPSSIHIFDAKSVNDCQKVTATKNLYWTVCHLKADQLSRRNGKMRFRCG